MCFTGQCEFEMSGYGNDGCCDSFKRSKAGDKCPDYMIELMDGPKESKMIRLKRWLCKKFGHKRFLVKGHWVQGISNEYYIKDYEVCTRCNEILIGEKEDEM